MADEARTEGAAPGGSRKMEIGAFLAFIVGVVIGVGVMIYVNRMVQAPAQGKSSKDVAEALARMDMDSIARDLGSILQAQGNAPAPALRDLQLFAEGVAAPLPAAQKRVAQTVEEAAKATPDDSNLKKLEEFIQLKFYKQLPKK